MRRYETEKPLTINDVIDAIYKRDYVLPAIQRSFVWDENRIIRLFDSVMRNYPINTFMIWNLKGQTKTRDDIVLYDFLSDYCRYYAERNPLNENKMRPDDEVSVVIDGQQRLTSLNIGLNGFYCGKKSAGSYPKTRDYRRYPKKQLYLNLSRKLEPTGDENELQIEYEFKFLSDDEIINIVNRSSWFLVKNIRTMEDFSNLDALDRSDKIQEYLQNNDLICEKESIRILNKLYEVIRIDSQLSYYKITEQDMNFVLDVFLRTNSGGVPLTFSELLLAITVDKWHDAREKIDKLIKDIKVEYEFTISRDFVMKSIVTLLDKDVKFKVSNFNEKSVIYEIKMNWDDIEKSIKSTFSLVNKLGFTDATIRAKNSVILIAYYIFKNRTNVVLKPFTLDETEDNTEHEKIRGDITKWLSLVLITGQFGGQSDQVIHSTREIIKTESSYSFPLTAIIEKFAGNQRKSLSVTNEFIEKRILNTQKDTSMCFPILALLFPEYPKNFKCDIDHMHPRSAFEKNNLRAIPEISENDELFNFFSDKDNWNSLPNLQLKSASDNRSKNDQSLSDWLTDKKKSNEDKREMFIPQKDSTFIVEFLEFKTFYESRKELLIKKLKEILVGTIDDTVEEIEFEENTEME